MSSDARSLTNALAGGDVSGSWAVWSAAAETSLADACPVLQVCLSLSVGWSWAGRRPTEFRSIRFGGPNLRSARAKCADPEDGGHVGLNRDASTTPLFDLRRSGQGLSALGSRVQLLWIALIP